MNTDALASYITELGIPIGIVIWLAIGIIKLITEHGPTVISRYQERKYDETEHTQDIENRGLRHEKLMELIEASSRTYTEDQLTHHLSEVYVEFQTVNAFIREVVFDTLQRIETKVNQILSNTRDGLPIEEQLKALRQMCKDFGATYDDTDKTLVEEGNDAHITLGSSRDEASVETNAAKDTN